MKEQTCNNYEKKKEDIEIAVGETLGLMVAFPLVILKEVIDFFRK